MEERPGSVSRVEEACIAPCRDIPDLLGVKEGGLSSSEAVHMIKKHGDNRLLMNRRKGFLPALRRAFFNPFSTVLMTIAVITWVTSLIPGARTSGSPLSLPIMTVMILVSGFVRLFEELRAEKTARSLMEIADVKISVMRDGKKAELPPDELAVGDYVFLETGDMVPADIRMVSPEPCTVTEAVLTGESGATEKRADSLESIPSIMREMRNILFRGSVITGGSAEGYVVAVGKETAWGSLDAGGRGERDGFRKGSNSVAWVLIGFMAVLVPVVFVITGLTQGNWVSAFLFALSAAVGLMPELLPMVMTACLARGSSRMGRKDAIVKDIDAIEALGSMDTLCVDKTGTLTEDRMVLEYWMDVLGNESALALDLAYMSVLSDKRSPGHMEKAIRECIAMPGHEEHFESIRSRCRIVSEMPFDYVRRISSVCVDYGGRRFVIAKGSPRDMAPRCSSILWKGERKDIEGGKSDSMDAVTADMSEDGMKVIAIAVRETSSSYLSDSDENGMVLVGYITFFDAPKKSAAPAIKKLRELNVSVKVLTGDGLKEAVSTAGRLGISTADAVTGAELSAMGPDELMMAAERCTVFSDLTPSMKKTLIEVLRGNGHVTGFLGDGMNDLSAVMASDVGISVENASEAMRETADVILRRKDLSVVTDGITEGRKSFMNMKKYVKITAGSNLGNIAAVVIAGIFLPFLPMTSVQLLLLNLLYDVLCLVLPWDSTDPDRIKEPLEWSGEKLPRFMLFFGPLSTVFDAVTFAFLFFVICPGAAGGSWASLSPEGRELFISLFQTGWFLESMWSQVLILHLLRTEKKPYRESSPSMPVTVVTLLGTVLFTILTFTEAGRMLGMTALPIGYFLFLAPLVLLYMLSVSAAKKLYLERFGRLI